MPYRTGGVFAGDDAVGSATARTAVLAKAFDDAAGEYFTREHDYRQGIEEHREQMRTMRLVAGASVLVGVAVAVAGRSLPSLGLGTVAALLGIGYSYVTYMAHKDEVKRYQEQIAINSPDGSVQAVTQVGLPFYLVPYDDEYLVFDGLGETPTNEVKLAHVDTDRLAEQEAELADLAALYDEHLDGHDVVSPAYLDALVPDAGPTESLEGPLADEIDEMRATVTSPTVEERSVPAHGTNTVAESLARLDADDQLSETVDLVELSTDQSRADWDRAVADARRLRHDALDEATLDPVRESAARATALTDPAVDRLEQNRETVEEHYGAHGDIVDDLAHKQTCEECLLDRCDRLAAEFSLLDDVLGDETGAFGAAVSDLDLDEVAADGGVTVRESVRGEIDANLPAASEELRTAYNSLPDLDEDELCPEHGETDRLSVPEEGVLFGTVWRCLYDEFREGVLDTAEALSDHAAELRTSKEENMVDLAQYEGISDLLEREYRNGAAQEATAAKIDRVFDQLETRLVEVESPTGSGDPPSQKRGESDEAFRERLEERLDEKKAQVRDTKREVLDSYGEDIQALTEEFLTQMPDGKASVDGVEEEFDRLRTRRAELVEETAADGVAVATTHESRLSTLTESRTAFTDAVEAFLDRREATAAAVTDLKTPVERAAGFDRIVVPFWVAFVERDGTAEALVYPPLLWDDPDEQPEPGTPYVDHLRPHPVHDYEPFLGPVREHLTEQGLFEELRPTGEKRERREAFTDLSALRESDAIADRFLEELQRYEL